MLRRPSVLPERRQAGMVGWKRIWEDVSLYSKNVGGCWRIARDDGDLGCRLL